MEKKKLPPMPPAKPEMKMPPVTEPPKMPEMYSEAPSMPKCEMDVPMESLHCPGHHPKMSMPMTPQQMMPPHYSPYMEKAEYHMKKTYECEQKCVQYKGHKQKYYYYMKKRAFHKMKYKYYMKKCEQGYHYPYGKQYSQSDCSCSCHS